MRTPAHSKGRVERLVGYAKHGLVISAGSWPTTDEANEAAMIWCAEVSAQPHSEIAAVPDVRLATERSVLPAAALAPTAIAPTASREGRPPADAVAGELVITHAGAEFAPHQVVRPGEMGSRTPTIAV